MALRTLTAKNAAALDAELMSSGGFSVDQLMELAGLSVAQAVYRLQPPSQGNRVVVACGPGNNGGDGLVAARHLFHFGYKPTMYYPKQGKNELYQRLTTQLKNLSIPFTENFSSELSPSKNDYALDAIFGFSFTGEVRQPFPPVIEALAHSPIPVLAVDAPSSWNIESGPPSKGVGHDYQPASLISLTAPKPLVKWFVNRPENGRAEKRRHFVGGRFLEKKTADKYEIDLAPYKDDEQVVELPVADTVEEAEEKL